MPLVPMHQHPGGRGWTHRDLPRLSVPVTRGPRVPHGALLATVIRRVTTRHVEWIAASSFQALEELASWIETRSQPSFRPDHSNDGHPFQGVRGQAPLSFAFFDPFDRAELDGIRAVILAFATAPVVPRGSLSAATQLASAIDRPHLPVDTEAARLLTQWLDATSAPGFAETVEILLARIGGRGPRYDLLVRVLLENYHTEIEPDDDLGPITHRPQGSGYVRVRDDHGTPPPEIDPPDDGEIPPDDLIDIIDRIIPPIVEEPDETAPDETEEPDEESTHVVDDWLTEEVVEDRWVRDTRLRLFGPVLPNTDRVLTSTETRLLMAALETDLEATPGTHGEIQKLAGCIGVLLTLATGRHPQDVALAISAWLREEPDPQAEFSLTDRTWRGELPVELPPLRELPPDWFHPTQDDVELPLPRLCIGALARLRASVPNDFSVSTRLISDQVTRFRASVPRLGEARIRSTIIAALYVRTGHPRDWQLVTGSTGYQSPAPLHYYATTADELAKTYCAALGDLGIDCDADPSGQAVIRVGAPRAALRLEPVRRAVRALREHAAATLMPKRASTDSATASYNAMACYTAAWFSLCTAHRWTAPITQTRRGDLLSVGRGRETVHLATVHDKGTDAVVDTRIAALTSALAAQVDALLHTATRAISVFSTDSWHKWKPAIDALRASIDGSGPLWVWIDSSGSARPLNRHRIATAWPAWAVPLPLARHLLASTLGQHGAAGGDIAQQMGHAIDTPPHDMVDPESPIEFARRMAGPLEAYLTDLGFGLVHSTTRRNRVVPDLVPNDAQTILGASKADEKTYAQIKKGYAAVPTDAESAAADDLAAQWMHELQPTETWLVDPAELAQRTQDYMRSGPTPGEATAMLAALNRALRSRATENRALKRPAIPPLVSAHRPIASIRRVHLDAYRLCIGLELKLMAELLEAKHQWGVQQAIAARLLLAMWGMGSCPRTLDALLDSRAQLSALATSHDLVVAEVPTPDGDNDDREARIVPSQAVAILLRLHSTAVVPTESDWSTFTAAHGLGTITESQCYAIISMARQITVGGMRAAWERGDLHCVGPSPDRLAAAVSGAVTDRSAEITSTSSRSVNAIAQAMPTEAQRDWRRLRSAVHALTQHRGDAATRKKVADLSNHIVSRYPPTSIPGATAIAVLAHLNGEDRYATSSIYTYITRLTDLANRTGSRALESNDQDWLADNLNTFLLRYQTAARSVERRNQSTALSALSWLWSTTDRYGYRPDDADYCDGVTRTGPRRAGGWITASERGWILDQLRTWTDQVTGSTRALGQGHTWIAGELGTQIMLYTGPRVSEVAGARTEDLLLAPEHSVLHIHPRRRRTLKTTASRRVVDIAHWKDGVGRVQSLCDRLSQRRTNVGGELLATRYRMTLREIIDSLTGTYAQAATKPLGALSTRTHLARHTRATQAGIAVHPHGFDGFELVLPVTDGSALTLLPQRVRYVYHSRQLGHGTPITTLTWYDHCIPLQTVLGSGWRGPTIDLQVTAIGMNKATYLQRSQRAQAGESNRWSNNIPTWPTNSEMSLAAICQTPPEVAPLAAPRLAPWLRAALAARQGLRGNALSNELGIDAELTERMLCVLERCDRDYGIGYLRQSSTAKHSRRPRAHSIAGFIQALDDSLNQTSLTAESLAAWAWQSLATRRQYPLDHQSTDVSVRSALQAATAALPSQALIATGTGAQLLRLVLAAWSSDAT